MIIRAPTSELQLKFPEWGVKLTTFQYSVHASFLYSWFLLPYLGNLDFLEPNAGKRALIERSALLDTAHRDILDDIHSAAFKIYDMDKKGE